MRTYFRLRLPLFILLLLTVFVISACSSGGQEPAPAPEATVMEQAQAEEEAMSEDEMDAADEEAMDGDEMETEEDMDGESEMERSEGEGMSEDKMDEDEMDEEHKDDDEMADSDEMNSDEEDSDEMSDGDTMTDEDEMKEDEMADDDAMSDEDTMEGGEMAHNDDMMDESGLTLDITGLEDLGEGWAYEGWLIVDGAPVSTGVFIIDAEMMASAEHFDSDDEMMATATAFVLTVEPSPDDDPAPSAVHILGGDFDGDSAQLSVGHAVALGNDYSEIDSTYILGIPTSDSDADSYTSGIWFDGLNLPELPAGWVYEGWVVGPDGPMSTGRFTKLKAADSDGAGPTAGPKTGPAYAGQDYLNPAIDLTSGYAAVISIEPEPDNSPAPFTLKPLVDEIIEDVGDHVAQALANNAASFPTGIASRSSEMMESASQ